MARKLGALRNGDVLLFVCLSVRSFVSLSPVKFVKSFATWQHLAASGGFSYRLAVTVTVAVAALIVVDITVNVFIFFWRLNVSKQASLFVQISIHVSIISVCTSTMSVCLSVAWCRVIGRRGRRLRGNHSTNDLHTSNLVPRCSHQLPVAAGAYCVRHQYR